MFTPMHLSFLPNHLSYLISFHHKPKSPISCKHQYPLIDPGTPYQTALAIPQVP